MVQPPPSGTEAFQATAPLAKCSHAASSPARARARGSSAGGRQHHVRVGGGGERPAVREDAGNGVDDWQVGQGHRRVGRRRSGAGIPAPPPVQVPRVAGVAGDDDAGHVGVDAAVAVGQRQQQPRAGLGEHGLDRVRRHEWERSGSAARLVGASAVVAVGARRAGAPGEGEVVGAGVAPASGQRQDGAEPGGAQEHVRQDSDGADHDGHDDHEARVVVADVRELVRDDALQLQLRQLAEQAGGDGDGGVSWVAAGGEGVGRVLLDHVDAGHGLAGADAEVLHDVVEVGVFLLRHLPRLRDAQHEAVARAHGPEARQHHGHRGGGRDDARGHGGEPQRQADDGNEHAGDQRQPGHQHHRAPLVRLGRGVGVEGATG